MRTTVASALIVHLIHGDLILTLESATAALVVTCPCAFGIAVPLAYEVVQTQLRRAGVFVRRPSLFDRLGNVEKIVFDKTGTLTTGLLELADPATLDSLLAQTHTAWQAVASTALTLVAGLGPA